MKTSCRAWVPSFMMALAVGACSPAVAQTVDVVIRDYQFDPATIEIKVGQTVKWSNGEKRTSHSLVFQGPLSFETERLFPGESWVRHFAQPGTYPYHCGPHPEMIGQVIVTE